MVANNAGQPATPADLINVDEVIGKYYDLVPDPEVPEQRVIFGTSGHRGSSLKTSFNEAHIIAISQAIAEYRKKAGVTGPLYLARHPRACPARPRRPPSRCSSPTACTYASIPVTTSCPPRWSPRPS